MRISRRTRVVVICCVCFIAGILLGILLGLHFGCSGPTVGSARAGIGVDNPAASFTISGDVAGSITPGSKIPLDLKISNADKSPLAVTHLIVTVKVVNAPQASARPPCTANEFLVTQVPGELTVDVPAESTRTLEEVGLPSRQWPAVGMRDTATNQDGCKEASLTLVYSAEGRPGR
jgi:hypothetical protein